MRKTNGIVEWSFEKLDFFQLPITKVGFIMLILSKFQIINAKLWSIYSKTYEFMVYTFICAV